MRFETCIENRLSGRHKKAMFIANCKDKKVLDIGCSFGWFEKFKAIEAREIVGIDLNRKDLQIARKEAKFGNVKFLYGSALNLNLKKGYFDVAVMFDVIEHLPSGKEEKALKEISKVLKEDGKLVISTPADNFSKFFDIAGFWNSGFHSGRLCLKKQDLKLREMKLQEDFGNYSACFSSTRLNGF
jgi:2-polyprenyl-3-methyl-5-hydroxy-6-metoxy-1,4-benzoquinol methylase